MVTPEQDLLQAAVDILQAQEVDLLSDLQVAQDRSEALALATLEAHHLEASLLEADSLQAATLGLEVLVVVLLEVQESIPEDLESDTLRQACLVDQVRVQATSLWQVREQEFIRQERLLEQSFIIREQALPRQHQLPEEEQALTTSAIQLELCKEGLDLLTEFTRKESEQSLTTKIASATISWFRLSTL